MNGTKRVIRNTGKVFLALLGGILFPILIWVALGVAINQGLREKKATRQIEMPTLAEVLATIRLGQKGVNK